MKKIHLGKRIVPLWLVVVLLISGIGSGALAYYVWRTLTMPFEVMEPLELLNYPSQMSLYAGDLNEFNITIQNHSLNNYTVTLDFHLSNTTYQTSYVTFSNKLYLVVPGEQNLTASAKVQPDAPSLTTSLTIDFKREAYSPGLVGYWNFDEGIGTTAYDSSGNNNMGTLINGPIWVIGKYGNALHFDGTSTNNVYVANSPSLQISNSITVMAWVKVDGSTNDWQAICTRWLDDSGQYIRSFILEFQPDGKTPWFKLTDSTLFEGAMATSNRTITFGEWVHLAGTYDGSSIRIYVDGVLKGITSFPGHINVGNMPLVIGGHVIAGDPARRFNGIIDEVRVYNRALSAEEIQACMSP